MHNMAQSKTEQDSVTRNLRLKKIESKLIDEFLEMNPLFDFSSLARHAILQFIRNPELELKSISKSYSEQTNKKQNPLRGNT
jgi:hypothetical protein